MVKVPGSSALIRAGPSQSSLDQNHPKISKHKVVLESVTQEKKKLRSVLSFKAEPPKGYTFIPAGNPELTNALKEYARKGNHEIYAVSTTPHQRAHDLSQQVHRIGFHFPSVVVAQVCAHYGIVLTSAGTVLEEDESQSLHRHSKRLREQAAAQEQKDQITINTEARDTIRDLFPNIPDNDLNQIIKTAFQKGHGKVGTAIELSLIRRAQLAVVAHIRHVYTVYDKLLRQTHYREARNLVEKPTLRKLVEWRGDDENGKQVLEDVFREVVVISDDEDVSEDDEVGMNDFRDVSVEIISSHTKSDHFNPDPLGHEEPVPDRRREGYQSSHGKRLSGHKFIAPPKRKERTLDQDKANRRGFSRYQAWNEAREEYRANPTDGLGPNNRDLAYSASKLSLERSTLVERVAEQRPPRLVHQVQEPFYYEDTPKNVHDIRPDTFRAEDGTVYERIASRTSTGTQPLLTRPESFDARMIEAREQVRSIPAARDSFHRNGRHDVEIQSDTILPSIEAPSRVAASSQSRAVSDHRSSFQRGVNWGGASSNAIADSHMDGVEFLDLTGDSPHLQKRRRLGDVSPEIPKIARTPTDTQNLPSDRGRAEYISLLSPAAQDPQPRYSVALSPSRYHESHGRSNFSSFVPIRQYTQAFPSPSSNSRAGESPRTEHLNSSHFHSREGLHPSTSSPRVDDESISLRRLRSALPLGATPVDRGIQEYRAFRARERQDKAMRDSPGRGGRLLHKNGDPAAAATRPTIGRLKLLDGAEASHDVAYHLTSQRTPQEFVTVGDWDTYAQWDEHGLTRQGVGGRLALRRRSASPIPDSNRRSTHDSGLSRSYLQQPHEGGAEYISMDWETAPLREDGPEPVLIRPSERYEGQRHVSTRYLPQSSDVHELPNASFHGSYGRL